MWVLPHPCTFPLGQVVGWRAQPRVTGVLLLDASLCNSFTFFSSIATIRLKVLNNFTLNRQQASYRGQSSSSNHHHTGDKSPFPFLEWYQYPVFSNVHREPHQTTHVKDREGNSCRAQRPELELDLHGKPLKVWTLYYFCINSTCRCQELTQWFGQKALMETSIHLVYVDVTIILSVTAPAYCLILFKYSRP